MHESNYMCICITHDTNNSVVGLGDKTGVGEGEDRVKGGKKGTLYNNLNKDKFKI